MEKQSELQAGGAEGGGQADSGTGERPGGEIGPQMAGGRLEAADPIRAVGHPAGHRPDPLGAHIGQIRGSQAPPALAVVSASPASL